MKYIKQFFHYIENFWIGPDGKPSIQRGLAIVFSIHVLRNVDFAIRKWSEGKSLADMGMIVGLELGFIGALIGITQWVNFINRKMDTQKPGE